MIPCPERAYLRRLLDGTLPEAERAAAEAHVETCDRCQAEMEYLTGTALPAELDAALRDTPAVPRPTLPDIELLEVIGRGGSGRVWKGRLKRVSQAVAVKVLTGGVHADAGQQERFLREVDILSRLQHPGLIRLYHFGLTADGYYYSMAYLPAGSLADDRERQHHILWPIRRAAAALAAVARAIQHAHDRHVIHRDLKPGNILLDADGRPVVADFGIAKLMGGAETTGTSAGTPCYMAPEQAAGRPVDARTDVYGIGAVLYDALTGLPPIPPGESDLDVCARVVSDAPVPPRRLRPELPADLERVCLKCLEKDPRHRYPTAAALADELDRFLAGQPVRVRPLDPASRAIRWGRRNPTVAALSAALGAVVLTALVAATVLWRTAEAEAARANAEAVEAVRQRGLAREALLAQADALTKAYEHIALTTPAERERFGDATARLLALLDEDSGAVEFRHKTAVSLVRFGVILRGSGEKVPAERLLRTATDHLGRLADRMPDDKMLRCDYSDALAEHGGALELVGRRADGIDRLRAGEEAAVAAAARWPDSDHANGVLTSRRMALAMQLTRFRRYDEAEKLYAAAFGPARELARKYPHDFTRHGMVANLTSGLGRLHLERSGDADRFLALHAEWDAHVDWVRTREPEKWGRLTRPWELETIRACVLARVGKRAEAVEVLERAAAGCRAADPTDPESDCRLATALHALATLLPPGDPRVAAHCEEAGRLFDRASTTADGPLSAQHHARFLIRCPHPPLRDAERAILVAGRAAAREVAPGPARLALGICLAAGGKPEAAEQEIDRGLPAVTGTPRIEPLVARAAIRFKRGNVAGATADIREATALARQDWFVNWLVLDDLTATAVRIDGTKPDLTPDVIRLAK